MGTQQGGGHHVVRRTGAQDDIATQSCFPQPSSGYLYWYGTLRPLRYMACPGRRRSGSHRKREAFSMTVRRGCLTTSKMDKQRPRRDLSNVGNGLGLVAALQGPQAPPSPPCSLQQLPTSLAS